VTFVDGGLMISVRAHALARNSTTDHSGPFAMKFLRIRQVMQVTGLSRMTIYRLELAGKFPKRRQLSENSVAWLESDIAAWADSRPIAHLRGTPASSAQARRLNYDWHSG
jgi:prophage regulatory protein